MLKNAVPRLYQEKIFANSTTKNTLVVLPTGLGKTMLAMMLAKHRLDIYPESKILMIAPTKPLTEQHLKSFSSEFSEGLVLFTGEIPPAKREEQWKYAKIIFTTPQGLENDVISDRIKLEDVSLIVFDEAHRAVGDYSYNFIAKQYVAKAKYPRILGLTASPGSNLEKITEVCKNLNIENIEVKTEQDPDVAPYVQEIDVDWIKVDLPPAFLFVKKQLDSCYISKLNEIKHLGYLNTSLIKKKDLIELQTKLHGEINSGDKTPEIFKSISLIAEATKVQHAIELLETQGIASLYFYMEKLKEAAEKTTVKSVKNLVSDERFRIGFEMVKKLYDANVEHPKIAELKKLIIKNKGTKTIIFSQFRDTASKIKKELDSIGISSIIFVGQAKKKETGLTQKRQKEILEKFRAHEFDVLIATSVAEEGLDVPNVDLVVFYEPVPSAIRTIQRRGRTGRHSSGRVVMLMANKTRDEAYHWSTQHKEKAMHRLLKTLKDKVTLQEVKPNLTKYITEEIKIVCDDREKSNGVVKQLVDLGIKIDLKRLDVGDYVLSERCVVELKTVPDFVDSIVDGRLLEQLKYMVKIDKPILIIEGTEDIYAQRNIHPNAIRGMLSTIAVSYGIPILWSKNNKETAELIYIIAKREQDPERKHFTLHNKKPITDKEVQEYIVSSLPNIGPSTAKELLHHFRTVRSIFSATEEELKKVPGIGDKTTKEIQRTLDKDYYT